MRMPTVAIVGRPNVGKSSLFNRFMKRRLAVVEKTPGVTRDRNYAVCDWNGINFNLVDTGGMAPQAAEMMDRLIHDQAEFAIAEADLVIFLVDCQVGTDPVDLKIASKLKQAGKTCLLVANKADTEEMEYEAFDLMKLGLGEPFAVSAMIGRNIGDLLDRMIEMLPPTESESDSESGAIRVAVVGRPNVGKSSFINQLLGKNRLIVTPIAGTTRDAVDSPFKHDDQDYVLIDTAGLRRKYRVHENIEFYTNIRTTRAVEGCDVAVVLVDASDKLTVQDQRILQQIYDTRRPAVLVVNKWDLIEKETNTADEYAREMRDALAKNSDLPIIFISAETGQRAVKVLSIVLKVHAENQKRIPTSQLNDFIADVVNRRHPPARRGKHIRFYYAAQTEVAPPTFVFFSNHPTLIDRSYIGYLDNQLKNEFGFAGVPIRLKFKKK